MQERDWDLIRMSKLENESFVYVFGWSVVAWPEVPKVGLRRAKYKETMRCEVR